MEEAYAQLYQEFLRLRTLCLRQASLLQQLTAALKQKGHADINLRDIISMPTQLDSEYPVYLNTIPQPPPGLAAAAPCSLRESPGQSDGFSDLMVQDMSRLSMDATAAPKRRDPSSDLSIPQSLSSHMTVPPEHASARQHRNGDSVRLSAAGCPLLGSDPQPQSSGTMVSDVALQSHVCNFCEAVFPADTTTRGQYLQHVYTHVT